MEVPKIDKKTTTGIILIWQLVTTVLLGYGFLQPRDVQQVLTTAEWMKASEIELNSSLSMLEKGYCLVNKIGTTIYAFNYTSGYLGNSSTNANTTIQWALDNSPAVLIKAAAYGVVEISLNAGNRLIIEKGATTITVSVKAGATCFLEDYNTGVTKYYNAGTLATQVDYANGIINASALDILSLYSSGTEIGFVEQVASAVSIDSTYCYWWNGTNNELVAKSTNASEIFVNVLGNSTAGDGISVRTGNYTLDTPISITAYGISFFGESMRKVVFKPTSALGNKAVINVTGRNCHLHDFTVDAQGVANITGLTAADFGGVELNLHLEHVYTLWCKVGIEWWASDGVAYAVYAEYSTENNWYVHNAKRNTFVYSGGWAGARGWYLSDATLNTFLACQAWDATANEGVTLYLSHYNTFQGSYISENAKHGIWLYGSKGNLIEGCHMSHNSELTANTYDSVYLSTGSSVHSVNNSISHNYIYDSASQRYGINEADANQDFNMILDNQISPCTTGTVRIQGANSLAANNMGFATENTGSVNNVTATTFSFLHGIAGTPTTMQCSFNTNGVASYTWTANSTAIDVTITSSNQIFVPYNGKIADITKADTNKYTLDLAAALPETRKIIAVLVCASRMSGTGDFFTYPNEGATSAFTGADTRPIFIVIADGTQRLQYSLGTASSDWDLYCKGYVVEAYSLPATITCYWSAEC